MAENRTRNLPAKSTARTTDEAINRLLTGEIVGVPVYRTGRNLSAVAAAWIDDAVELGLIVIKGPDGNLWRAEPYGDDNERHAARRAHWLKLDDRPPLMRAVRAAVLTGVEGCRNG